MIYTQTQTHTHIYSLKIVCFHACCSETTQLTEMSNEPEQWKHKEMFSMGSEEPQKEASAFTFSLLLLPSFYLASTTSLLFH